MLIEIQCSLSSLHPRLPKRSSHPPFLPCPTPSYPPPPHPASCRGILAETYPFVSLPLWNIRTDFFWPRAELVGFSLNENDCLVLSTNRLTALSWLLPRSTLDRRNKENPGPPALGRRTQTVRGEKRVQKTKKGEWGRKCMEVEIVPYLHWNTITTSIVKHLETLTFPWFVSVNSLLFLCHMLLRMPFTVNTKTSWKC